MGNGRIPLASNQNAINSPFRGFAPLSTKRSRAQVETSKDIALGQPPSKKVAIEADNDENFPPRTFTRQSQALKEAEMKLFTKRPAHQPMTAFERKLVAVREAKGSPQDTTQPQLSPEGSRKATDSLDNIRQWQRHYRKAFPTYVFYFESVPDDIRHKISRLVQSLGAKEEKFFSRTVTHVVTTRPIPASKSLAQNGHDYQDLDKHNPSQRTIDPSLLDRRDNDPLNGAIRRTTDLLDSTLQAKSNTHAGYHSIEPRKLAHQSTDILTKARELDRL